MTRSQSASKNPTSHYPPHTFPRVCFITAAASPIGISLARELLAHGDIIVAGDDGKEVSRSTELAALLEDAGVEGWGDRLRVVKLVSRCEVPVLSFLHFLFSLFFFSFFLGGNGMMGKGQEGSGMLMVEMRE